MSTRSTTGWLTVLLAVVLIGAGTANVVSAQDATGCAAELEPDDRPEEAALVEGEGCFEGSLPEKADQDLWLWDVRPEDGLSRWSFQIAGVPGATTSVHVIPVTSAPGVFPLTTSGEVARADSDPDTDVPGSLEDVQLAPGRYLLGVSRADPVAGRTLTEDRGYRFQIGRQAELPPSADGEPNDTPATASVVPERFEFSGDLAASADHYLWTLGPDTAGSRVRLEARTSLRAPFDLALLDGDGQELARAQREVDGAFVLHDLGLAPGDYIIAIRSSASAAQPYVLRTVEVDTTVADPEPDDDLARAAAIDPTTRAARGRISHHGDRDSWWFDVRDPDAATLLDIELSWDGARNHQLCLQGEHGPVITCRDGDTGVRMRSLALPVGRYTLTIAGPPDLERGYELRLVDRGAARSGREVEPNDATPATWDPSLAMEGDFDSTDDDAFRLTIEGPPQLWQLEATGTGLVTLAWLGPNGAALGSARAGADGTSATLTDLYLLPGEHTVRVRGRDGAYALRLVSLGDPDAASEREPNDDAARAERLVIGGQRSGRLVNAADVDVLRFSLDATENVRLRVEPPSDAAVSLELTSGDARIALIGEAEPGEAFVYDARLLPGDYHAWLRTSVGSAEPWTVTLERGDAFDQTGDLEPNDVAAAARPLPSSLEVAGTGRSPSDDDWYLLPALPADGALAVVAEGEIGSIYLLDAGTETRLSPDAAGTLVSAALAAGSTPLLHISATGPYRVAVSGAGLEPRPQVPPPVTLSLRPETATVAAYWPQGQRLDGSLDMVNTAAEDVELLLGSVASQPGWTVTLGTSTPSAVTLPAGSGITLPVTVEVPPDAPADVPVRIAVQATLPSGGWVSTEQDITPGREAPAVGPTTVWPLPSELLGGMDAASLALGGVPVSATDAAAQGALHDGHAVSGGGYQAIFTGRPIELTVDLAGDGPIPVSGFIIDALAGDGAIGARPRDVELQLSEDGLSFATVHRGALEPGIREQAIVLDDSRPARAARLIIHSSQAGASGAVALGEWKVVATPGSGVGPSPIDLAEPASGGHVAWMTPQPDTIASAEGLVSADLAPWAPVIPPRTRIQWVVGFREDRTAQITGLRWVDPPASAPGSRSDRVTIDVSTSSPLGPWQTLGEWPLIRAADGSVAPFDLAEPTWARFVRFTMDGPQAGATRWEMPSDLAILERPADAEYRSVLGEWGRGSPRAIHEMLVAPTPVTTNEALPDVSDTADAAAVLPPGDVAAGRVTRHADVDWYALEVPDGQDTVVIEVVNSPGGGVRLSLVDAEGRNVRLFPSPTEDPAVTTWSARVSAGAYRVLVEQPALATAFVFDVSGSLAEFVPYVQDGLRSFARGVEATEERVRFFPFGEVPPTDWSDDPYLLEQAVNGATFVGASSDAERTLLPATAQLGAYPGTRSILLLTDAETTSYDVNSELWGRLDEVRPIIHAVHLGGAADPGLTTSLMQDWAASAGGHYQYVAGQADIDRAFDRLATWLRRPADYSLSWRASAAELPAATVRVGTPLGPSGVPVGPPIGKGVGVELVLDTSGSMNKRINGVTRMAIAQDVLTRLVNQTLPEGIPVALRTFKAGRGSCDTIMVQPFGPLDRAAMSAVIAGLRIDSKTRTPLGATLHAVGEDLAGRPGPNVVVFVTDGKETCKGDPEAEVGLLVEQGIEVAINIVGFALDDEDLKAQMAAWAALGGGTFVDAQDGESLLSAISTALQAPYRVYDEAGTIVARGVVGGPAVKVPGYGVYDVEVLAEPAVTYKDVALAPGDARELILEPPEG